MKTNNDLKVEDEFYDNSNSDQLKKENREDLIKMQILTDRKPMQNVPNLPKPTDEPFGYHFEHLNSYSTSRPATLEEIIEIPAVKKHISQQILKSNKKLIEKVRKEVLVDVQGGIDENPQWYAAIDLIEATLKKLEEELG